MLKLRNKTALVLLAAIAFIGPSTQRELHEGSVCSLHNGQLGICKNSQSCRWVRDKMQNNEMTLADIRRCLFVDSNNEIICCGDQQPTRRSNDGPRRPKPCSADTIIFDESDCTPNDTDLASKIGGSRLTDACTRYSALATVLTDNIINGKGVTPGEFPHVVALGYANEQGRAEYEFNCGATLIADNWVISAAHCIKESRRPIMVRMGMVDLHSDEDVAIDRTIVRIIRHPEYSARRKTNDIALIQFGGTVEFNDFVRPACVRTDKTDMPAAQELIIAGWGSIDVGTGEADRPSVLLKATVSMVALADCNRTLTDYNRLANQASLRALSVAQMCALNPRDNSDACQGDSGGPLFVADRSGVSTLVGVISFGVSCGSHLPGVYTRVAAYTEWIESVVWPSFADLDRVYL